MSDKLEWGVLPPGSPDAVAVGCTCPVLENARGEGTWIDTLGKPTYWVERGCPLHASQPSSSEDHRA